MTDYAPHDWTIIRETSIDLIEFLKQLAETRRYALFDHEREQLRECASALAASLGRPDLAILKGEKSS